MKPSRKARNSPRRVSTPSAQGWERVKTLAEARHAPREHLEQIEKHMGRVAELGKAQAHIDGMRNLDKNIAALSHDPRYQQHGRN
jgi:hypothetical protein